MVTPLAAATPPNLTKDILAVIGGSSLLETLAALPMRQQKRLADEARTYYQAGFWRRVWAGQAISSWPWMR